MNEAIAPPSAAPSPVDAGSTHGTNHNTEPTTKPPTPLATVATATHLPFPEPASLGTTSPEVAGADGAG